MGLSIAMLCLFTWLYIREGGFHQFHPLLELGVMLMFWMFGLASLREMSGVPLVSLVRSQDEVILREYWLNRRTTCRYEITKLPPAKTRKVTDSEGDDQYLCYIELPEPREVTLASFLDPEPAREFVEGLNDKLAARWQSS